MTKKIRLLRRLVTATSVVLLVATGVAYQTQQQEPQEQVPVESVYDGDTFRVIENGSSAQVRVLGIDAPELRPAQCYGIESRDAARKMIADAAGASTTAMVVLTGDLQQGDTDQYQRLLRYVQLEDGTDLARELLAAGAATVYESYPVSRTPQYERAQQDAQANHRGMWAAKADGGCE